MVEEVSGRHLRVALSGEPVAVASGFAEHDRYEAEFTEAVQRQIGARWPMRVDINPHAARATARAPARSSCGWRATSTSCCPSRSRSSRRCALRGRHAGGVRRQRAAGAAAAASRRCVPLLLLLMLVCFALCGFLVRMITRSLDRLAQRRRRHRARSGDRAARRQRAERDPPRDRARSTACRSACALPARAQPPAGRHLARPEDADHAAAAARGDAAGRRAAREDAARPGRDGDHGRHHARVLPRHRQGRAAPAGRHRRADRERVRGPARVRAGAERARRGARPVPRRPAGAAPLPGEPGRERGALRRRRRHRGERRAAAAAHRGPRPRPGIPEAELERVFEPFYRLEARATGTAAAPAWA